jgi:hypothetical protein
MPGVKPTGRPPGRPSDGVKRRYRPFWVSEEEIEAIKALLAKLRARTLSAQGTWKEMWKK